MRKLTLEKLFEKTIITPAPYSNLEKPCRIWTGSKRGKGLHLYGFVQIKHKRCSTHRLSYIIANGEISKDSIICHFCDVCLCVEPSHLFLGTHLANAEDKVLKNRQSKLKGENCPTHKLYEKDIIEIRKLKNLGWTITDISNLMNCSRRNINSIVNNKTWTHI